jgi:hypothetical protein
MLTKRIIPCLDVKGGRVVKGQSFVNLRDAEILWSWQLFTIKKELTNWSFWISQPV